MKTIFIFREAAINNTQRTPRKTPRYMMPTEAATRKSVSSRSDSPDPREKYPHDWYESQENNSESDRIPDNNNRTDYSYKRKEAHTNRMNSFSCVQAYSKIQAWCSVRIYILRVA